MERDIERALVRWVRQQGGRCPKLKGELGFPDRTILLPDSCALFVELKQPGGKVRKGQIAWHEWLKKCGHPTLITDNLSEAQAFILTHTRTDATTS